MRIPRFAVVLAMLPSLGSAARAADRPVFDPPFQIEAAQADSIGYKVRIGKANLVGITVTNYGFVGNNFISRDPSLEYPLGTGYEHLVRGGLWIGAHAQDDNGSFTGVTTAAQDGSQGGASQGATEFTPAGSKILGRSTLINSPDYSPKAVSELDLVSDFSDRPAKSASRGQAHRPMGLLVRQENYAWSFSDYQHLMIFHYRIINDGPPLADAWVGFYSEFASGPKNLYSSWPPSSSGSALGSWYRKKWIQYDDSLRLFREHYCQAKPTPTNCDLEQAPYWMGIRLLGWKRSQADTATIKKPTLSAWSWAPGNASRDEDVERYALMSTGVAQSLAGDSLQPGSGDPVSLFCIGPFTEIDPGDSISVDFAVVGGAEIGDIQEHSRFAQRAFDHDYIVPTPPPSPRLKVVARHNALDLYWDHDPEDAVDPASSAKDFEGYRVYIGEDRLNLSRVAQFDKATPPNDTTGFNTGFGAVQHDTTIDNVPYHYRYTIDHLRDGFKYFVAVTSYDLGTVEIESLESGIAQNKTLVIPGPGPNEHVKGGEVTVFPNPYRVEARWDQGQSVRDHYLWFTNLPERAKLRIYTLSGDLVFETDFDGRSYRGEGARGIYDPRRELDVNAPTLSGTTYGWNMITREGEAIATGLYVFSVEDQNGKRRVGKFLVVKSDREGF